MNEIVRAMFSYADSKAHESLAHGNEDSNEDNEEVSDSGKLLPQQESNQANHGEHNRFSITATLKNQ